MGEPRADLSAPDDREVERALRLVVEASADAGQDWIRTVLRYLVHYRRTRDPEVLDRLATNVLTSLRLRSHPGYDKEMRRREDHPSDPARDRTVDEVLADPRLR